MKLAQKLYLRCFCSIRKGLEFLERAATLGATSSATAFLQWAGQLVLEGFALFELTRLRGRSALDVFIGRRGDDGFNLAGAKLSSHGRRSAGSALAL